MNIAIILAGGTGKRLGAEIPKQYIEVQGRPIISYCLAKFAEHERIDGIQIVADVMWRRFIQDKMDLEREKESYRKKFLGFSDPGKNRQLSILQGLKEILSYRDHTVVVIHDAVRPCVTKELISKKFFALLKGIINALNNESLSILLLFSKYSPYVICLLIAELSGK